MTWDAFHFFLDPLLRDGSVDCPSPKIRRRIYKYLKSNDIPFTKENIGYTDGERTVDEMGCGHPPRLLHMIDSKRILRQDANGILWKKKGIFRSNYMDILFDKNANRRLRLAIADTQLEKGWFGQWRLVPVKKPIVRIQTYKN